MNSDKSIFPLLGEAGQGKTNQLCHWTETLQEAGEAPEAALVREIREELATEICVERYVTTVEWDYPTFHLSMRCYLCSVVSGSLTLLEHEAAAWLDRAHLRSVQWLPADEGIIPEIEALLD